jgi:hypothetical protein
MGGDAQGVIWGESRRDGKVATRLNQGAGS